MPSEYLRIPNWKMLLVGVLVGLATFITFGIAFFRLSAITPRLTGEQLAKISDIAALWIAAPPGIVVGLLTSVYLDLFKPPYMFHWLAGAVAFQLYLAARAAIIFSSWYFSDSSMLLPGILIIIFFLWLAFMAMFVVPSILTGLLIKPITDRFSRNRITRFS